MENTMTRTHNAFVLAVVLASGLALATSTKPVSVGSVVSNATPITQPSVGVLFSNGFNFAYYARHHAAWATRGGHAKQSEPVSPAEFFDRK